MVDVLLSTDSDTVTPLRTLPHNPIRILVYHFINELVGELVVEVDLVIIREGGSCGEEEEGEGLHCRRLERGRNKGAKFDGEGNTLYGSATAFCCLSLLWTVEKRRRERIVDRTRT